MDKEDIYHVYHIFFIFVSRIKNSHKSIIIIIAQITLFFKMGKTF